MTEASRYLFRLAERITVPYASLPGIRAIMVIGSAALGVSDFYSDLDLSLYHEALPSDEDLATARERNGARDRLWLLGDRADGSFAEAYLVDGVECQLAHTTVAAWERDMATVLIDHDVSTPLQKALSGTLDGVPLLGDQLIQGWKATAAQYPAALAEAMVEKHLSVFPLWRLQARIGVRDATLWQHEMLIEAAQNILGVLAGLNHRFYSAFQFKRMGHFIDQMNTAPPDLGARLEGLFTAPAEDAALHLEELMRETVALVEQRMPQIETGGAKQHLGSRQQAWEPMP